MSGRAEEEADGAQENNQPSVEESSPRAGHLNSGREVGSMAADALVNWVCCHVMAVLKRLNAHCALSQGERSAVGNCT